jgi:hypothetical protein
LLWRLDERTAAIQQDIAEMKADTANFVTHAEFGPVRALVFGAVALILAGFLAALLYLTGLQH